MFKRTFTFTAFTIFCAAVVFHSCKKEDELTVAGFPPDVAAILNQCATSGCHNDKSKDGAAGLSLETWDRLFEGGRGGASVIPYRPDFSTLIYYVNSYDEFGTVQLQPKMPYERDSLTSDEVRVLYNWILSGAPNDKGEIKFSNPSSKKFYVGNQGCDVITVFDAATMLAARYIDAGSLPNIEAPHMIRVSPDNQHYYASFVVGSVFQKFRVDDNSPAGQVELGFGSWNTFAITSDSKRAFVTDLSGGQVADINIETMQLNALWTDFTFPHGSAVNKNDDTLYVTGQTGNFIYKIPVDDPGEAQQISMEPGIPPSAVASLNIHEILFLPDFSKYIITCQNTNDVRIVQTSNDSVLSIIPVGVFPQEIAVSKTHPYLFISCTEDTATYSGQRGSVYVINYQTNSVITNLYAGHQSHAIAVDDQNNRAYITNRNATPDGPAPHHSSSCGGRNGFITAIDMNTLQLVTGFKAEVSVDPYGMGIMH